ncbi:MAG: hypothetical protein II695_09800 [Oscillospiraceae bacterium]|nr:hypothetical protein [Oscillospiraceae bacterium]
MVKVYVEDGQFKVKGTFDFGYMGVYKDDLISVDCDCSDIRYEWDSVYEMTKESDVTDEDIAAYITGRFNEAEEKIQKNIRMINSDFLYHIYDDMKGCSREFWEREELRVPGFDYDDPDFNFYRIPLGASGYKGYGVGKPNDGSVEKSDFEASLRENAPMFNLDNFIKGIKPESMVLSANYISFQCSDIYNWALICGAYDRIDLRDLSFTDWHNY